MMLISPTPYQRAVLSYRGHVQTIAQLGGRGGGKTYAALLDVLMTAHELGPHYRGLIVRESWGGLQQISDVTYQLATAAFGPSVSRNRGDGTVSIGSTGAVISFAQISDAASYQRHQGTSIQQLLLDEAGGYTIAGWRLANRLRSNLRVAAETNYRPTVLITGNPGGLNHNTLRKELVAKGYWRPFADASGELAVVTHSTFKDNPKIEQELYRRQLEQSTGRDEWLRRAWLDGSFDLPAGVLFEDFDPTTHVISAIPYLNRPIMIVGADFGQAAPCCGLLIARSREPTAAYERGSFFVVDETHTAIDPDDPNLGSGAPASVWAEMLKEMLERNRVSLVTDIVQDDARGLHGETVTSILNDAGLNAYRPGRKDRVGGWAMIRDLLAASKSGDGPGLYVHERCKYLLATLPELQRGQLRPDDCDPLAPDHAADALRMGLAELIDAPTPQGAVLGTY